MWQRAVAEWWGDSHFDFLPKSLVGVPFKFSIIYRAFSDA